MLPVGVAVAAALLLALPLAGCGKKASPERPLGSDFPRQYPNPAPPPPVAE